MDNLAPSISNSPCLLDDARFVSDLTKATTNPIVFVIGSGLTRPANGYEGVPGSDTLLDAVFQDIMQDDTVANSLKTEFQSLDPSLSSSRSPSDKYTNFLKKARRILGDENRVTIDAAVRSAVLKAYRVPIRSARPGLLKGRQETIAFLESDIWNWHIRPGLGSVAHIVKWQKSAGLSLRPILIRCVKLPCVALAAGQWQSHDRETV